MSDKRDKLIADVNYFIDADSVDMIVGLHSLLLRVVVALVQQKELLEHYEEKALDTGLTAK